MACQKVIHLCDMFYFNSENGSFLLTIFLLFVQFELFTEV